MQPNRQLLSNGFQPDLYMRTSRIGNEFSAVELGANAADIESRTEKFAERVEEWEAASIVESTQRRAAW